jgi:hypothetical protein
MSCVLRDAPPVLAWGRLSAALLRIRDVIDVLRKSLILRKPRSGCLEGRTAPIQRSVCDPRRRRAYRWQIEGQRDIFVGGSLSLLDRRAASSRGIMPHILVSDDVRLLAGAGI